MLKEETKRKLRLMGVGEYIQAIELQDGNTAIYSLPFQERFQLLTDSVYQQKYDTKVQALIKGARFRLPNADVHDVFYHKDRPLDKNLINELATCCYVEANKSIVLQGYTSSGKTYLACALGKEACRKHYKTRYIRVPDLLMEFDDKCQIPGGKERLLRKYATYQVLILDEWLLQDVSKKELEFLFELSERRFDKTSTIFCTLYHQDEWVKRLGKGAFAESLVERYRHNTYIIESGEMNMREKFSSKTK